MHNEAAVFVAAAPDCLSGALSFAFRSFQTNDLDHNTAMAADFYDHIECSVLDAPSKRRPVPLETK